MSEQVKVLFNLRADLYCLMMQTITLHVKYIME